MRGMSALWTSAEIEAATGGRASAEFAVSGVTFDSREVGPGDLFVAMPGTVHDGHAFVAGAFGKGAAAALVSQPVDGPHVLVSDVAEALAALASAARARLDDKAVVIGVTGSVGKTSTKEALAAALARSRKGHVHRSVKSYNNHTGVPLSLARMPRDTCFAVLEMGMNHAGEIAALTRLVRPHVALITAIAPAHIENLGSIEAIADAKGEIFEGLEGPRIGIIPEDTPQRERLVRSARGRADELITFGRAEGADVTALHAVDAGLGTLVTARLLKSELTFTLSQRGDHWISNALALLAVVEAAGGDLAAAGLALGDLGGLKGRGERHRIALAGGGEALLIDESYNANPASMAATLKSLGEEAVEGRRIAVLGPMRELGEESEREHAAIAEPVLAARVERLILIGPEFEGLAAALDGRIAVSRASGVEEAGDLLLAELRAGDAVLVKASNSIGLAKLVERVAGGARPAEQDTAD